MASNQKRKPKTGAERQREYLERKKLRATVEHRDSESSGFTISDNLSSVHQDIDEEHFSVNRSIDQPYMITTNIDVSDGLANGAVGNLTHIEHDDNNEICRVWLLFPHQGTGVKLRKKSAGYAQRYNIDVNAVPIARRNSTIRLNKNKTINAKRNHFPLLAANCLTIHKAQGGTYGKIVYYYNKNHSQNLVYVALTRVSSIDGLYIVSVDNMKKFYHGLRNAVGKTDLCIEFERLRINHHKTVVDDLAGFISRRPGLSITSFNCQSLRAHSHDLTDKVFKNSHILMLSETWIDNEQEQSIPNFNCIVKYKNPGSRGGGVAIYHNSTDTSSILTPHMDIDMHSVQNVSVNLGTIGKLCAAECQLENGQVILLVSLYIHVNKKIDDIIYFIHKILLPYTMAGSELLGQHDHQIPMILSGDFNVNFAEERSKTLISFLKEKLNLNMVNDCEVPTTRCGTTIDAVFHRYLDRLERRSFFTYFSYQKALVSFLENESNNDNDNAENQM